LAAGMEWFQSRPTVRVDGEPPSVHEHREWRSVGQVMAKEVLEQEVEGAFFGPVIVTSVDHGAASGRILLVIPINHRHFPHARVRVLGARIDLASLGGLVVQSVRPHGRLVLTGR